jgi:hypothetical protein
MQYTESPVGVAGARSGGAARVGRPSDQGRAGQPVGPGEDPEGELTHTLRAARPKKWLAVAGFLG